LWFVLFLLTTTHKALFVNTAACAEKVGLRALSCLHAAAFRAGTCFPIDTTLAAGAQQQQYEGKLVIYN
jgi:hypothetical protein